MRGTTARLGSVQTAELVEQGVDEVEDTESVDVVVAVVAVEVSDVVETRFLQRNLILASWRSSSNISS